MSDKLKNHFEQFDPEWLRKFFVSCFGKYGYTHTASATGLDTYLSNLRSVSQSHPDDLGCVVVIVHSGGHYEIFNMVDFKDEDEFLRVFTKYQNLKAFL